MLVKWSLHVHYNDKIYITQLIHHFSDYHIGLKPLWTVKLYKSWTFRARFLNGPLMMPFWGDKNKHKLIAQRTFLQQSWATEYPQTSCKKVPWLQLTVCDKSSVEQRRCSFISLVLCFQQNFYNFLQLQMKTIHFIKYFLLQLPARLENTAESYTALNPNCFFCWED